MTRCILLMLAAWSLGAGEAVVPRPVAELLAKVAPVEPTEAVAMIDAQGGELHPLHPLLLLARGQARLRLEHRDAAEADFRAALASDSSLRQAHLGLAQCAAAREDWVAASRSAAAGLDLATADAAQLGFLAAAASRAGDWRLATLTAQHGIMRFPDDQRLRRVELDVLVHAGRAEDARQAVLALLAVAPADAGLWRSLAWTAQETGRSEEALAALEAALGAAPDDAALRCQLAERQLARGLPQAALLTVRPLLSDPARVEDDVLVLASRCAAEAGEVAQARSWLDAVPEARRSRAQRIQAARLAVQAGDPAAAGTALDALVAAGETDGSVLTWAAALAEGRGEDARAEVLYLRAASQPAATLRLVALFIRQGRRDEAATTLASYLVEHPGDTQAKALQARLGKP